MAGRGISVNSISIILLPSLPPSPPPPLLPSHHEGGWVGGPRLWQEGVIRGQSSLQRRSLPRIPREIFNTIFNLWLSVPLENLNLFAAGLFKKRCWARSDLGTTFILQTRPAVRIGRRSETTPWRALKSIQQTEY